MLPLQDFHTWHTYLHLSQQITHTYESNHMHSHVPMPLGSYGYVHAYGYVCVYTVHHIGLCGVDKASMGINPASGKSTNKEWILNKESGRDLNNSHADLRDLIHVYPRNLGNKNGRPTRENNRHTAQFQQIIKIGSELALTGIQRYLLFQGNWKISCAINS